jgi:hypothetical protein
MDRITIGAPLGGAAIYFLDSQRGEDRRRRVQSFWRENRDTAFEVGGGLSQAAESVRPLVRRVKRGLGEGTGPKVAARIGSLECLASSSPPRLVVPSCIFSTQRMGSAGGNVSSL